MNFIIVRDFLLEVYKMSFKGKSFSWIMLQLKQKATIDNHANKCATE